MRLLFSVIIFIFLAIPRSIYAQTPSIAESTPTPTPVNYSLAYPGILPDNPLYPVKMLRDRIVYILINDPYKKAQFNLLQADKRLEAGLFLIDQNQKKASLAIDTISKGENYFHDAVADMLILKKQGRDVLPLLSDLDKAASKHLQVLSNLMKTVPEQKGKIEDVVKRMTTYQQEIKTVK